MKCFDIQTIIKNYESYVINWTRPLATALRRKLIQGVRLVRALSFKLGRTLPLTQRVGGLQSPKLQASSPKLLKIQATSIKPQAASVKLKATSVKLLDSRTTEKFHGA